MLVSLKIDTVIKDIRTKSHLEVSSVADPAARYKAEAGTEKLPELKRLLVEANAEVYIGLRDYLVDDGDMEANNIVELGDYFVYQFIYSDRRFAGKAQALADAIHAFLVDRVLSDFYISVSIPNLSQARKVQAEKDWSALMSLIRTKKIPRL